jgi:Riboflavin kinase
MTAYDKSNLTNNQTRQRCCRCSGWVKLLFRLSQNRNALYRRASCRRCTGAPHRPARYTIFPKGKTANRGPDVPRTTFSDSVVWICSARLREGRQGSRLSYRSVSSSFLGPLLIQLNAANLPDDAITPISSVAKTGVYYGYAQVLPLSDGNPSLSGDDTLVHPMVMSLGWNPFYKNEQLSAVCLIECRGFRCSWLLSQRKFTSCTNSSRIFMGTIWKLSCWATFAPS